MTSDLLLGTWQLVSWENRTADGRKTYPFGEDAKGLIVYGDDGYMFVAIMAANRTPFGTEDLFGGSLEENAKAAETYVSYCGRYELHGETVIHHVELSLFPNWVGVDQERVISVTSDRLELRTRPTLFGGTEQTAHLVWARAEADAPRRLPRDRGGAWPRLGRR